MHPNSYVTRAPSAGATPCPLQGRRAIHTAARLMMHRHIRGGAAPSCYSSGRQQHPGVAVAQDCEGLPVTLAAQARTASCGHAVPGLLGRAAGALASDRAFAHNAAAASQPAAHRLIVCVCASCRAETSSRRTCCSRTSECSSWRISGWPLTSRRSGQSRAQVRAGGHQRRWPAGWLHGVEWRGRSSRGRLGREACAAGARP